MLDRDHKSLGFSTTDTDLWHWWIIDETVQSGSRLIWTGLFRWCGDIVILIFFSSQFNSAPLSKHSALAEAKRFALWTYRTLKNRQQNYWLLIEQFGRRRVIIDSWQLLSVQVRLRLMKNCIVFYFLCCWTSVMFNLDGCKNSVCKSSTAVINWMTD